MTKDIVIKEIKPLGRSVLTTAEKYEDDFFENGLLKYSKGETRKYQKVVAVGNFVTAIKVGDIVMVNPEGYAKKQYDPNSVKSDMGMNKTICYNIPTIEVDGITHMLLTETDIDYVITKYDEVESEEKREASKLIIPKPNLSI